VRRAIAVFGATSGIARAVAELWMARGEDLVLIGRSRADLEAVARDLEVAFGRRPPVFVWDAADSGNHRARFEALAEAHPLKGLLMAAGVLHGVESCEADEARMEETFRVNLAGPAVVAGLFAHHLAASLARHPEPGPARPSAGEARGPGSRGGMPFVSVITSVAGDRGRASNYPYGASKAGLSAYLEGLRQRLRGSGVLIQDVKPGPIRTRMTAGMRGPAMASPETAARDIVRAIDRGRDVVYTPGYWRIIMAVIRAIPAPVFKRMKL
jgi:short-subunit dehydrogenase